VWKSGGVRTPQLVAIEAYRLLSKLGRIVRLKRGIKLGSVSLEVDESSVKVLENLVAGGDQLLPSPRLMVVDMIAAGAFERIPPRLGKNVKSPGDIIATIALYPFGGLIANTIASTLKASESKQSILLCTRTSRTTHSSQTRLQLHRVDTKTRQADD